MPVEWSRRPSRLIAGVSGHPVEWNAFQWLWLEKCEADETQRGHAGILLSVTLGMRRRWGKRRDTVVRTRRRAQSDAAGQRRPCVTAATNWELGGVGLELLHFYPLTASSQLWFFFVFEMWVLKCLKSSGGGKKNTLLKAGNGSVLNKRNVCSPKQRGETDVSNGWRRGSEQTSSVQFSNRTWPLIPPPAGNSWKKNFLECERKKGGPWEGPDSYRDLPADGQVKEREKRAKEKNLYMYICMYTPQALQESVYIYIYC